jgi:cytochrome c peroxidase
VRRPAFRYSAGVVVVAMSFVASGCAGDGHGTVDPLSGDPALFRWELPAGFAPPAVPADNPMSAAKVELGRRLFYDTRLSGNGAFACSSCHRQEFAFSDARNVPLGSTGEPHTRNSMALANVGYLEALNWGDSVTSSLEAQSLIPMFGEHPVELGLKGLEADLLQRLQSEPVYQQLFPKAFPGAEDLWTVPNVTKALAAFQRTFISVNAPYDRYRRGQSEAISAAAKRGELLFFSSRTRCVQCHSGALFTLVGGPPLDGPPGTLPPPPAAPASEAFFNTGLYNVNGTGAYPPRNRGLFETSGVPEDMGRMKVPSLRNIALSFPYMHDGSISTLEEVVDHYARGGRLIVTGPNAGDGQLNPFKNVLVRGFTITPGERADLVAFLRTLADSSFITSRRLANPWR